MEAPWSDQFDQTNIQLIDKSKVSPEVIIDALLIEMKQIRQTSGFDHFTEMANSTWIELISEVLNVLYI